VILFNAHQNATEISIEIARKYSLIFLKNSHQMIIGKVVHGMGLNNAHKYHGKIKDSLHVLFIFLQKMKILELKL
jgi:hypothetical protein